jgi:hypothetical protein
MLCTGKYKNGKNCVYKAIPTTQWCSRHKPFVAPVVVESSSSSSAINTIKPKTIIHEHIDEICAVNVYPTQVNIETFELSSSKHNGIKLVEPNNVYLLFTNEQVQNDNQLDEVINTMSTMNLNNDHHQFGKIYCRFIDQSYKVDLIQSDIDWCKKNNIPLSTQRKKVILYGKNIGNFVQYTI